MTRSQSTLAPAFAPALAALALALAAIPLTAAAAPFADLAEIDRAVAAFTGQLIGVQGGARLPVDRRLRLSPCSAPLALSWRGATRDSVLVQCPDADGWRLYVPVAGKGVPEPAAPGVARGEVVTVSASGDGFSVSQAGEALDSAPIGGWVRVRTGDVRSEPIRGRVVRPGLVEIPVD